MPDKRNYITPNLHLFLWTRVFLGHKHLPLDPDNFGGQGNQLIDFVENASTAVMNFLKAFFGRTKNSI